MKKYIRFLKNYGIQGVFKKFQSFFYQKFYIYQLDKRPRRSLNPLQLTTQKMDFQLLDQIYATYPQEISAEKYANFKRRLQKDSGIETWVCMNPSGQIYGHLSIDFGTHYEEELRLHLPNEPTSVYLYDGWISSEKRGTGYMYFMMSHILNQIWEGGFQRIYTVVENGNRPSEKSVYRMGFKKCNVVHHYKLFSWRKTIVKEYSKGTERTME